MRKIIGVYCITNLINEKIYIGSSSNIEDRWEYHRRLGKIYDGNRKNQLYNDIFLYGIENFDFKVVKECSISELENEEQKEIDKYPKSKIYNFEKKVSLIQRGVRASRSKISEEQLLEIITLLKENKISDRDIAKKYNICFNAISEINHGISYRIEGLQYPIRKFSQSKKRAFSIEEVKKFREEYEKDGLHPKEIYNRNKIKVSYNTFKAMLKRQTYKEIN